MEFRLVVDLSPATQAFLASIGLSDAKALKTVTAAPMLRAVGAVASIPEGVTATNFDDSDAVGTKRRGRPTKEQAAAKAAQAPEPAAKPKKAKEPEADDDADDDVETDDADDDADDDVEADDDDDSEDESDKISPEQLKKVKSALKTYSDVNGKDKALKVLFKFAKVSQDVKAHDFTKLMAALKTK